MEKSRAWYAVYYFCWTLDELITDLMDGGFEYEIICLCMYGFLDIMIGG